MPITMLTWNRPTSAPRRFAGAISARYTGASTEDPPMAIPARNRHNERREVPRKSATQCGDHIEHADDSQHVAAAVAVAGSTDDECSEQCAPQCTRNRRSETGRRERKNFAQRTGDAGDDGRVEAE